MDRRKLNRAYKKKVYELCRKAASGDEQAHAELTKEAEKNTVARWAIKHWKKVNQKSASKKSSKRVRHGKYASGSDIFAVRRPSSRTEDEIRRQEKINRQGYHDGAKVAGSNLRRVNK